MARGLATPTIGSFSPDSNIVGDGITDANVLTLDGTAVAGSLVSVLDGTTLLGTTTANAQGAWTFTTGTLADGANEFAATDSLAGNTSAESSTLTVIVDTQAPTPPVITGDATSGTNHIALSGTAEASSTVSVYDGTTQLGTASVNTSGAWSFTTATLAAGAHGFTVTDTDVAGNISHASSPLTVVIPAASNVDSNGHFSGVPTVTLTPGSYVLSQDMVVSNENLVITGCTFSGPGQIILSGTASLTGAGTLSNGWGGSGAVLIQDSGAYSIQGVNFDNVAALSCISVVPLAGTTISSLAIDANTFSDSNYGILRNGGLGQINSTTITNNTISNMQGDGIELNVVPNDNNIIIENNNLSQINNTKANPDWGIGIGVAGASYSDTFTNGVAAKNFVIEGNTISGAVQGVHVESSQSFTIQNNTLSNISASYSLNSGLEEAGIVTYGSGQFSILNNTVNVLDDGPGIYIAPGVRANQYVADPINFTVNQNTLNTGIEGIYWASTGTSSLTNNADTGLNVIGGISSNITVANNTLPGLAAPTIASFSPDSNVVGDGITNVNHLTLSGTAVAGSTVEVFDGVAQIGTAVANSSGAWSFATATLADGSHVFTSKDVDSAGNVSTASAALTVTVDTVAPAAPTIASFSPDSNVVGDGITNVNHLTLSGTAVAGSAVEVFDGVAQIGTATANSGGAWSFATATLADGSHVFTSKDVDSAGNVSAASTALKLTVDTVAPNAPDVLSDTATSADSLLVNGTAEAGSTVKLYEGTTLLGTAQANANGNWDISSGPLSPGSHDFTATATDVAGNVSGVSAVLDPIIGTVIQTDGSTALMEAANDYFLAATGSNTLGPEVTQGGIAVTPGSFELVDAVKLGGGGYDVAWQEIGSSVFTIWSLDGNGNFVANIGNDLAGNSTTLENFETTFGQDLNGDGTIGPPPPPPPTTISIDGNTTLVQSGNDYFLDVTGSNTLGPEVTQGGIAVTPGSFELVDAVKLGDGGYDVAWQEIGSSVFTIWSLDGNGNFVANIGNDLAGNSTTLENFETTFGQDLNGDGTIGPPPPPPPTTISIDGNTTLVQSGNDYFLDVTGSNTLGPEVTQGGIAVTPGSFELVDAVKLGGGGYDVAWQEIGSSVFTIWSLDGNGNFVANIGNDLAGNSTTLENFETTFGQDLNGDGTIGPPPPPPPTTISIDGNTTLVQSGNDYFLDVTGSNTLGPEVTQGGIAVTPGSFELVDAVKLGGGGYDVAWQEIGSSVFTIWSLDGNGNFVANIGNDLAGNSTTLENFETTFGQDLNGDGTIGTPTTVIEATGNVTLALSHMTQAAKIDAGATLELTGADSGSITFVGVTGTLVLDHSTAFTGHLINLTGNGNPSTSDQIDLRDITFGSGTTYSYAGNTSGGVLTVTDAQGDTANISLVGNYTNSTFTLSRDGHGGTLAIDPPKDNFNIAPSSTLSNPPTSPSVAVVGAGHDGFVFHPSAPLGSGSLDILLHESFGSKVENTNLAALVNNAQSENHLADAGYHAGFDHSGLAGAMTSYSAHADHFLLH